MIVTACGGDDGDSADGDSQSDPTEVAEPTAAPTPTPPADDIDETDLGTRPVVIVGDRPAPVDLEITDIVEGDGAVAAAGDNVITNYVGVLHSTGLEFDASWDSGQPLQFILGEGNVIDGWDQGIEGMAVGGRRELAIPAELAYGSTGSGSGRIGPDEPLIFVVDLVGLVPADDAQPDVEVPDEPADELVTDDLVVGTGDPATPGDLVYIHYVGAAQSTGEVFDSSWGRGLDATIPFVLGTGLIHEGLEQGIEGMAVGGRRRIVVPAELAYGDTSAGNGAIAPGETLVFVVDLVGRVEGEPLPDAFDVTPEDDGTDTGEVADPTDTPAAEDEEPAEE